MCASSVLMLSHQRNLNTNPDIAWGAIDNDEQTVCIANRVGEKTLALPRKGPMAVGEAGGGFKCARG